MPNGPTEARRTMAALAAAAFGFAAPALGQPANPAFDYARRSAIVVAGTVEATGASLEPLLTATGSTAVIHVEHTYAGAEIAGDLAGQRATVILSRAGADLKPGSRAIFYGDPRFIGKTVTIADVGETPATEGVSTELSRGLHARLDAPLAARLAIAEVIFAGRVEQVRPVDRKPNEDAATEVGEHDPELRLAMVRVASSLRGAKTGQLVPVAFADSCDIMWCNSPKLRVGQNAVIIAHQPKDDEAAITRSAAPSLAIVKRARAVLVTAPFDVLPPAGVERVRVLLQAGETK